MVYTRQPDQDASRKLIGAVVDVQSKDIGRPFSTSIETPTMAAVW